MKSVVLGLVAVVLLSAPAFAARGRRVYRPQVSSTKVVQPTVVYTSEHAAATVQSPSPCKDGKCRLSR